jgi:cardiolipin synthase (CMP-forming)
MKTTENKINVPNALSAYRIVVIPLIVWALYYSKKELFVTLICINLVTDVLDGLIARIFKLCTEFGAKLDSTADLGTFILTVIGFFVFEMEFLKTHWLAFTLMIGLFFVGQLFSLIKFKTTTTFHLYSNKFSGYMQGIFIFTFFIFGYFAPFFYFMIVVAVLAELEVITMVYKCKKMVTNARSLFLFDFKNY